MGSNNHKQLCMAGEKGKGRLQETPLERYVGARAWNTWYGILTKFHFVSYTVSLFHKLYYFYLIHAYQVTATSISTRFLHRPYRHLWLWATWHTLGTLPNNSITPNLSIPLWHVKDLEKIVEGGFQMNKVLWDSMKVNYLEWVFLLKFSV